MSVANLEAADVKMGSLRFWAWLAIFLGSAIVPVLGASTNEPSVNPDPAHLVWIMPGSFLMGSPKTERGRSPNEGPQTRVTITQGFWMSKYEVTQEDCLAVMEGNPSLAKGDPQCPVERITWSDATNYCAKLTIRERAAGRLPAGCAYRLPTEAEWEYACRAGTTTATAFGNSLGSAQANMSGAHPYGGAALGAERETTTKVGSYTPNAWGLHDMHGNVWEWCSDWHAESLPGGSVTDPQGPPTGTKRVIRGGGWASGGENCRSAKRSAFAPDLGFHVVGFRPVLAPGR